MDYYYHEFEKLQDEFHETLEKHPLFKEDNDKIFDVDIKDINELIEKNDEFYLKKAISKLKDLIDDIKDRSKKINLEYDKFDKLVNEWNKKEITNISQKELDELNKNINSANSLIKSHDLKKIMEANNIMENVLKKIRNN